MVETPVASAAGLDAAYARAVTVTREEARNFYYGIRLLPSDKRAALCALYALARRVDDIGDGDLPGPEKGARLTALRRQLDAMITGGSAPVDDPILIAVADVAGRYPVPLTAFLELIDGVEMDVSGRRYQTFDELVEYCRCVAGAIGRLCLGIFGNRPHPQAEEWADTLGIALQQTNILRDIREDLRNGRVYVPQEDLDKFGVTLELDPESRLVDHGGGLSELIRFSAARAREWYAEGLQLVPLLDRRSAACCAAMAGIYRQLLADIESQPSSVFDQRLSLSGPRKARAAARALTWRSVAT